MLCLKSSVMSAKLDEIGAVNTSPKDNPFCMAMAKSDAVCAECYSVAMLETSRQNCRAGWAANGDILALPLCAEYLEPFANSLSSPTGLIRFHAHGELLNRNHAVNFYTIAHMRPDLTFALWTKRPALVKGLAKPDNLVLIYSNPSHPRHNRVMASPPKGFDKVFNVVGKDYPGEINCGAKACKDCRLCYERDNGVSVIVERVKRR